MHLLVTGAAGFIGSVVAEMALEAGHSVVVIDDLRGGHRAAVPGGCQFVEGDVGDPAALARAFALGPFDAVVHLAAEAAIAASVTDPAVYFNANLVAGITLLDAMRAHGCHRLVFSSTAATYGEPRETPMPETHAQSPINAYGESKLQFERVLAWYCRAYGLRAVSFRYFNAAGATATRGEARDHETHLIPLVLDAMAGRRGPLDVFGNDYPTRDGTCVRDYVHVADIAAAHLQALDRIDGLTCEFFNIGSETGYTVLEVIAAVERVVGRPVPRQFAPRRPGDPAVLVASASKIRTMLGWAPTRTLAAGATASPTPGLDAIVADAWHFRQTHPHGYQA